MTLNPGFPVGVSFCFLGTAGVNGGRDVAVLSNKKIPIVV